MTASFQSTHSLRSATNISEYWSWNDLVSIHALLAECDAFDLGNEIRKLKFQSTHSLRSATCLVCGDDVLCQVSIHALLAECDLRMSMPSLGSRGFNPRTPCGVRLSESRHTGLTVTFQSTHSLRSATSVFKETFSDFEVSIHALLAECDCV